MQSNPSTNSLDKQPHFFYGYLIIFLAALNLFFSGPGQTFNISVFIDYYIETFGWTRTLVSLLYSVATVISGTLLYFVGRLIDTLGHRKAMPLIATALGLTCLLMSFVQSLVMLFIGFLFLRYLGQGSMTLLPSTLIPQWFVRKRGIALSLMSLGIVASSAVFPPLNNWLINQYSAAAAWRLWSLLLIGVMAPLGWTFVRNHPEEMNLLPDGQLSTEKNAQSQSLENNKSVITKNLNIEEDDSWTLQQAMKTKTYWFIIFCSATAGLVLTGLTFHMVSIVTTKGLSPSFAAFLISINALVQFPMTFVAGHLLDQLKVYRVMGINFLILAFAVFMILIGRSEFSLIIYVVALGVFSAFDNISKNVLWPNYFGLRHLGKIKGTATTSVVIGASLGPLPFGLSYDLLGSYSQILWVMILLACLASLAALNSPKPFHKTSIQE